MATSNGSNNVSRATKILLALGAAEQDGLSLAEIAEILGDSKPTVHRALTSMAETGFVVQRSRRGKYLLGPAIYALAQRTPSVPELVQMVRPKLIAITAETGLSAFLMLRAGLDSICIDMQPGRILASAMVEGIGGRVPLGVGLAGTVMLGQMDRDSASQILDINRDALSEHGLTESQVREEIDAYLKQGYTMGKRSGMGFSNLSLAFPVVDMSPIGRMAAIAILAPDTLPRGPALDEIIGRIKRILNSNTAPVWRL